MMSKSKKADESKFKIMIVEDEEPGLKELVELLEESYDIITATDGDKALQYILAMEDPKEISTIICDQKMPVLTGTEFLSIINEKKLMPNTKFILITGYYDKESLISAINQAHIYFFVEKPFDADKFRSMVKEAVAAYYMSNTTDIFKNQLK